MRRLRFLWALWIVGLFSVSPVSASPRIVELQLPSDRLTQLIWDRLYTEEICALAPFTFPPTGEPVILDRVTFPERPRVVLDEGQTSILVRADVFLRAEECLSVDCGPTEYVGMAGPSEGGLGLEARYDLSASIAASKVCFDLVDLREVASETVVPAAAIPPEVATLLSDLPCQPLPLAAFGDLLGPTSSFTQVGVGALPDGSRLAVRLEVDGPSGESEASWAEFADGVLAPTNTYMEWSVFVDRRVLEDRLREEVDLQFTCREDPSAEGCDGQFDDAEPLSFIRTGGPNATWSPGGAFGGGHLHLELDGEVPGGFSESPCINPIRVEPVEIDIDLHVENAAPNWLQQRMVIDPDPVDIDVLGCGVTLTALSGPLSIAVAQVVAAIAADLFDPDRDDLGLPEDCDKTDPNCDRFCSKLEDDEYDCGDRIDLGDPLDLGGPTQGVLTLQRMVGLALGGVLGGPFERLLKPVPFMSTLPPNPLVPRQPLRLDQGVIQYGVQGGCSNLHLGYSGSFRARGDGAMCSPVEILEDPPARHANGPESPAYRLLWDEGEPSGSAHVGDQTVGIDFPATLGSAVLGGFFADPYPLRVLMRTSAGLQHYTIGPPGQPAAGDAGSYVEELTEAFEECAGTGWRMDLPRAVLDRLWLVDPPPFDIELDARFSDPTRATPGTATLRSLSVSVMSPAAVVRSREVRGGGLGLELPGTMLLFRGEIDVDLGPWGRFTLPFTERRRQTLLVTELESRGRIEMSLSEELRFSIETPTRMLPRRVRGVVASFEVPVEALRFRSRVRQRREAQPRRKRPQNW